MNRFSTLYLDRTQPLEDSERFRRRIAGAFDSFVGGQQEASEFGAFLVQQTGARVKFYRGQSFPRDTFLFGELRDLLDAITVFYKWLQMAYEVKTKKMSTFEFRALRNSAEHVTPYSWLMFVESTMREENLSYKIDGDGVVQYVVDKEFEYNRAASLESLRHPMFVNSRESVVKAFRYLHLKDRDTKAAVRSMFEAVEILAKQICPKAKLLSYVLAEGALKDVCIAAASGDFTEKKVLEGIFDALGDWVKALHYYRHGQVGDAVVAPSLELAVHVLSVGSAYVRLLAEICLKLEAQSRYVPRVVKKAVPKKQTQPSSAKGQSATAK